MTATIIPFRRPAALEDADFTVSDLGSLLALKPVTDAAREWIADNLPTEPHNWWCGALAIEHRYWERIEEGIVDAGLVLR